MYIASGSSSPVQRARADVSGAGEAPSACPPGRHAHVQRHPLWPEDGGRLFKPFREQKQMESVWCSRRQRQLSCSGSHGSCGESGCCVSCPWPWSGLSETQVEEEVALPA